MPKVPTIKKTTEQNPKQKGKVQTPPQGAPFLKKGGKVKKG